MRLFRTVIRLLAVLAALTLLVPCLSLAENVSGPSLVDQGLDLGNSSIRYPQLTGLPDRDIQASVNAQIVAAGQIDVLLGRLPMVMSGPVPLTVTWQASLSDDVLSCAMLASGPVTGDRPTQVWSAVTLDLTSGEALTLDDLFAIPADEAREVIGDWLWAEVAPDLSAHLASSELTPLPEAFFIAPEGLTLLYPISQLSTLSDRAGCVTIRWYELPGVFDLTPGSVLDRLGATRFAAPGEETADAIRTCAGQGCLPGIPATLGDPMQQATDAHRLLTDPDLYEGGRMFALEDSRFRGCWLLTDALSDRTWDTSVVQGIRADRISLYGIHTTSGDVPGTSVEEWRAILGQPDAVVTVNADLADLYRIEPGVSDYYALGDRRLRLHADNDGYLTSVFLTY